MNYKELDAEAAFDLTRAARVSGRRVTAIGGGTGLSTLLLGLKEYTDNITAIVTVTDDGGGSGVLRREFGMLPPGDIRNCILSLANTSTTMNQLLNYRFTDGTLKGQSFGNLFLLALCGVCGSFEAAVERMGQFLAVTGRVLPVTGSDVTLEALFEDGSTVRGETSITAAKKESGLRIDQISLRPQSPRALDSVIQAIEQAELIVLGPGSLYTSLIPNLLVDGVSEAIERSSALKIYVLNIMTQEGETEGYTAAQHVQALNRHARRRIVDVCLYNTQAVHPRIVEKYRSERCAQLFPNPYVFQKMGVELFGGQILALGSEYARHDPLRLSYTIMQAAHQFAPRPGVLGGYDAFLLKE